MSAHARSWKCFLKNNMFLSLTITQMEGWKFEQLEVEGQEPPKVSL